MPRFTALLLLFALAACAQRGTIERAAAAPSASERVVFVATTRQPAAKPHDFTDLRTSQLRFGRYVISIPPAHQTGRLEWPNGTPDAATDFVTTRAEALSRHSFTARLSADRQRHRNPEEVVLFIHGFNSTFAEGTYRAAQMAHDIGSPNATVHYSWPATQKALHYTHDRDSVLFARDGLHQLLDTLARSGVDRIVLVAHSIGAQLLMETLRQASIARDRHILTRVGGVVLISPDIDVNLFETQIRRIHPRPHPMVIFGAEDDLALKLSALLTGQRARLGQLGHTQVLRRYGIEVINLSHLEDGEGFLKHAVAITSPTVLGILRQLPQEGRGTTGGAVRLARNLLEQAAR